MAEHYTISELAEEFGVSTRTLRFYEAEDLIHPKRRGRQRLYDREDRVRVRLILRSKRLGLSLAEISEILKLYEDGQRNEGQVLRALAIVADWRDILERQRVDIETMLAELDRIEASCRSHIDAEVGDGEHS
jgi:DNA-binding transcriptional MerR regulator